MEISNKKIRKNFNLCSTTFPLLTFVPVPISTTLVWVPLFHYDMDLDPAIS
jgi:hypothetical protein